MDENGIVERDNSYILFTCTYSPWKDEDNVESGEADEDAIGRAFHLRPAKDEYWQKVSDEAQRSDSV